VHITLRSPSVAIEEPDSASNSNEFRLHCRARSFILFAGSDETRREWCEDIRMSITGEHKEEKLAKDTKKKSEDMLITRGANGKVVAPTLTQTGKKAPKPSGDDDEEEEEEEEAPRRRTKSTKKKGGAAPTFQPNLLGDVIEYPSLPAPADAANPFLSHHSSLRPGAGFAHSSPGNPFMISTPTAHPYAGSAFYPDQSQALVLSSPSPSAFGSSFGTPFGAPASNSFAAPAANPFAPSAPASAGLYSSAPPVTSFGGGFSNSTPGYGHTAAASPFGAPAANPFALTPTAAANPFAAPTQNRSANPFM